ncbi:hypothetical protein PRIPAC_80377 [Pristionchus pacificus]|uniref:Uncharacterized protein n=1 Tax=Pristionchus pacificus TaxID=54126 RepID=A0A2A6CBG6_PRIPA|nr:hypothetical protein PRIPAC_80377 [Pristionchus pacificus]|eukprot:PDM75514.1 hypothetical protein PRIPAC_42691 [Pristionchus pacificus]
MNRNLHVSGLYVPGGHPHRTYSYITAEKRGVQPALQPQEPGEELLPDKSCFAGTAMKRSLYYGLTVRNGNYGALSAESRLMSSHLLHHHLPLYTCLLSWLKTAKVRVIPSQTTVE